MTPGPTTQDWPVTLGISYGAVVDPDAPLSAEPWQPAAWTALDWAWTSTLPDDRERILAYVDWLADRV